MTSLLNCFFDPNIAMTNGSPVKCVIPLIRLTPERDARITDMRTCASVNLVEL